MRIIIIASEAVPFAKTGGLGDVAGALPKALRASAGIDAALIVPFYEATPHTHAGEEIISDLEVEWHEPDSRRVRVRQTGITGAPVFMIDAPRYFRRPGFYGYNDDHERFAFFSRAALALVKRLGDAPDVVHLNDWFGGFAAVELKARRFSDPYFARTRTLFSIHNLAYQGTFDSRDLPRLGFHANDYAFMSNGAASALKAGLSASDCLSTVSPTYAREIQTPAHGYGLDWLLRERSNRLVGITNGIDEDEWNPASDAHTAASFDVNNLDGKLECKRDLLRTFSLPEDLERPIIGSVSRLTPQKGFDLVRQAAYGLLDTGAFFVSVGSGASEYEDFFQSLRDHAPHQVGIYRGYSDALAHKIEAGADMFLMPSLFEPCGLNQMYSMRYGTIPIVRATGGLDDTVTQFDRTRGTGTGFKFTSYTADAMLESIYEALFTFAEPNLWRKLQINGMQVDNSWRRVALDYAGLYQAVAAM